MQITSGKVHSALKVVIYGPEGIGKSTFASRFPNPVFIDTEGSTKHMDVARTPKPSSWSMLMEQVRYFKANPNLYSTLIMDTADWAEQLCMTEICAKSQKAGIEDFGYGKGYIYLAEEFGRLLNLLEDIISLGMNVVITAHAQMRKFEQPDEMGAYDRWELKLQKKTSPLLKEWADLVLFASYKTYVINVDGQGTEKGRNKAQGGKRVMYTTHHNCWDAKNRHNLPDEVPFDYSSISHLVSGTISPVKQVEEVKQNTVVEEEKKTEEVTTQKQTVIEKEKPIETTKPTETTKKEQTTSYRAPTNLKIPKSLLDLMTENQVDEWDIQAVVAAKGYYPSDTPIENYDRDFIKGVLVGAWPQVYGMIKDMKENMVIPFN